MAQTDRDVLFANESFLIGVLQVVSGGSLVAALAQSEALLKFAGRFPLLGFLTAMGIALTAAVLAAYWKHQYKMWDVKGRQASGSRNEVAEAQERLSSANSYLKAMRRAMFAAVLALVLGLGGLLVAFWVRALCSGFPA